MLLTLAAVVLPFGLLGQCLLAALRTRGRPDRDVPFACASLTVAAACLVLVASSFELVDPSECAALSGAAASALSVALAVSLLVAAALGLWMARLATRHAPVGRPLVAELASVGIAIALFAWLAGGTSC